MILLKEHCIVKVKSIFIDEMRYKDMTLLVNVMFRPERHIRCYGEIVSVPDILPKSPIYADGAGRPAYVDNPPQEWKTADDIALEVKIGDRAYFHYNCLLPDMDTSNFNHYFLGTFVEKENGKDVMYHHFRIKYELIFAVVRYEKVNAIADNFQWWMEPELTRTELPIPPERDDAHGYGGLEVRYVRGEHSYKKVEVMIGSYILVVPDKENWDD